MTPDLEPKELGKKGPSTVDVPPPQVRPDLSCGSHPLRGSVRTSPVSPYPRLGVRPSPSNPFGGGQTEPGPDLWLGTSGHTTPSVVWSPPPRSGRGSQEDPSDDNGGAPVGMGSLQKMGLSPRDPVSTPLVPLSGS